MERGFLTVATGEYFHYLAVNMRNSYHYSQKKKYPLCVITDPDGEPLLREYFDDVVVIQEKNAGYLNRLKVQALSPYDETIFIDADTLIVRDISDWWDVFGNSGYDVAVWGWNCEITSPRCGKLISQKAAQKYGITRYIGFNGGVYYFKKTEKAARIYARAVELLDTYIEDEQYLFNGKMGDEPVMAVALLENDIYGVEDPQKERMFCTPGMHNLKIDLLAGKCTFIKYDYRVNPAVMHWGTGDTKKPVYRREVQIMNMYQKGYPRIICYGTAWGKYIIFTALAAMGTLIAKAKKHLSVLQKA